MNGTDKYWQTVGEQWQAAGRQRLWRRHNDRVVRDLLLRWLGRRRFRYVLKTDLFEEAGRAGLASLLERHSNHLVVGIDVSRATARSACVCHPGIRAVMTDVRQLPFASGAFDVVISTSTLDHFRTTGEIEEALAELARILRPGGELLLTLDNLDNPIIRLRNALPFSWLKRTGLVPYYVGATCGHRDMGRLLRQSGFTVLESAAVLHCPRAPAVALARLIEESRLLRRGRSAFLSALALWELLARLPSRFRTGYFVAARAMRPVDPRND